MSVPASGLAGGGLGGGGRGSRARPGATSVRPLPHAPPALARENGVAARSEGPNAPRA